MWVAGVQGLRQNVLEHNYCQKTQTRYINLETTDVVLLLGNPSAQRALRVILRQIRVNPWSKLHVSDHFCYLMTCFMMLGIKL